MGAPLPAFAATPATAVLAAETALLTSRATRLVEMAPVQALPARQRTLKSAIGAAGVGVHSGVRATIRLVPAPVGHGIVFLRTDSGARIPARHDHVVDTRLCTVLGLSDDPAERVGTVEHVMAALSGAGIDNALIEVSSPEVPIMDGSAAPFTFLIDCAGIAAQDAPLQVLQVLRPIRVKDDAVGGSGATAALLPATETALRDEGARLALSIAIDFAADAIGHQERSAHLTPGTFRDDLAPARTFGFAEDLQRLRAAGLARGGSLANAVVLSGGKVVNEGGLRFTDEFVRHKLLDAVGDLALAGMPIQGRFVGSRSGHRLNNLLLRALFAQPDAWRVVPATPKARRASAKPQPAPALESAEVVAA